MPCRAWTLLALVFASAHASAQVGTERFAQGLASPTFLTAPPGDTGRVFVAELGGTIRVLDAATGAPRPASFLNLSGASGNGLLGLAFHPDYASNGHFYVYYQAGSDSRLERYTVSAGDPDLADAGSAHPVRTLLNATGHIGGWIGFGPDGYLYWQIGDTGGFHLYDPNDYGQRTDDLRANVLRLDVDGDDFPGDPDVNYAIPATNPFVGVAGSADEIWSYGLRNPFRGCFDRATGDYWVTDVGEDDREEINFQLAGSPGGQNYGWRLREGSIATPGGGVGGPPPPDGVDPTYEYDQGPDTDDGESITGGCVYRGPVLALRGRYFFADYVRDRIWSIRVDRATGGVTEFLDWTSAFTPDVGAIGTVVAIGEDAVGNLYFVDIGDGELFRVVGPTAAPPVPALSPLAGAGLALALLATGARRRLSG